MKVFIENIEPAWVRYTWEVELPDDTDLDGLTAYEMVEKAIETGEYEVGNPDVIGQIDSMDQEWKVTEVVR